MISAWTSTHLTDWPIAAAARAPIITADQLCPGIDGLDLWDMWPLTDVSGAVIQWGGGTIWFALSSPQFPDPVRRHWHARIRLLHEINGSWHDCGPALPDGLAPGSREWAGSAIFDPATRQVTLYFTAAGRRGEASATFEQRLFQTTGTLARAPVPRHHPVVTNWATPHESVASDGVIYLIANQAEQGAPGSLKAFRDPAFFRDPADGSAYLLFAASLATSPRPENGAIGAARATNAKWQAWALLPPILHADGLNNELERPHMLHHGERYYLFWSTQTHTFAPGGPAGPNGLYGMFAPHFAGPYSPLNGGGAVIVNPATEPFQAYSWLVLGDLSVVSFVDNWGTGGLVPPAGSRAHFGGVPAPRLRLRLEGGEAKLLK